MGDRANIAVKQHGSADRVYLYGHWMGSEMPAILQRALARGQRWNDGPYLARIIFCEMIEGSEKGETGFGISTGLCDNEHPIAVVDPDKQTVSFEPEPGKKPTRGVHGRVFGFAEYVALPDVSWDALDRVPASA